MVRRKERMRARVLRAMSPTVFGKVVSDDDGDEQKDEPSSKDVGGHR
jgi:hypothetical protein